MTFCIEVDELSLRYGRRLALDAVSFRLPQEQLVAVVGPNGAGKSSLVRSILGLEAATSRRCRVLGRPMNEVRRVVAWVPQRLQVDWDFPLRVRDVVAQGRFPHLRWWQRLRPQDRDAIDRALEDTGLTDLADRPIDELSGGQQQRMILARALAQQARLLILDEPLAGVDVSTEETIVDVLRRFRDAGGSVVVVHHDLGTVRRIFDYVLLLDQRVVAEGRPEDVLTPDLLAEAYRTAVLLPGGSSVVLDEG